MRMFDLTMQEEQAVRFRREIDEAVRDHVHGEDLLATGVFRQGGAGAGFAAPGGGMAHAAYAPGREMRVVRLPQRVLLAVTPEHLYAFELKFRGGRYTARSEVATWRRAGLRIRSKELMGLTSLTIESPAEREQATFVPIGVEDDPVSLELIHMLESAHPGVRHRTAIEAGAPHPVRF